MTQRSKTARAAAILAFTSGVYGHDQAVEVFDKLASSDNPVDEVLASFRGDVCRWHQLENISEIDWWDEVIALATSIDKAREHFKE